MLKKIIKSAVWVFAFLFLTGGCGEDKRVELTMSEPPWKEPFVEKVKKELPYIEVFKKEGIGILPDDINVSDLPILYTQFFTEVEKIVEKGLAKDITDYMNEYGFMQAMNPQLLELASSDGRIYAIPYEAYAMGIMANIKLYEAAGLANADGTLNFPSTYDEFIQTSVQIKEKTGKYALVFPSGQRYGGWLFMPIAWSFGAEFMTENENGKLETSFDTPECVAALQYIKDLKWKYDVVRETADLDEMRTVFSKGEAAMMFAAPPQRPITETYKMDRNLIACCRMPAGPAGRYSLMGGNLYVISAAADEKQTEAAFEWLQAIGFSPKVTNEMINTWERNFAADALNGLIVTGEDVFKVWVNKDTIDAQEQVREKYQNVDMKNYQDYSSFKDVIIRREYSRYCQELYEILDIGIQTVFEDENADVEELVHYMSERFRKEYLDKQ